MQLALKWAVVKQDLYSRILKLPLKLISPFTHTCFGTSVGNDRDGSPRPLQHRRHRTTQLYAQDACSKAQHWPDAPHSASGRKVSVSATQISLL